MNKFPKVVEMLCTYFPIPDEFEETINFLGPSDPKGQLDAIWLDIEATCYYWKNGHPSDILEYDEVNSKGCPQFCPKETTIQSNSPYRDCPQIMEKLANSPHGELRAKGYMVFPGNVGYIHPDHINNGGIYMDNPNEPGGKILDLDAMMKLPQPSCSFYQKAIFGD